MKIIITMQQGDCREVITRGDFPHKMPAYLAKVYNGRFLPAGSRWRSGKIVGDTAADQPDNVLRFMMEFGCWRTYAPGAAAVWDPDPPVTVTVETIPVSIPSGAAQSA